MTRLRNWSLTAMTLLGTWSGTGAASAAIGPAAAAAPTAADANYVVLPCGDGLRSRGQGAWYLALDCPQMTQTQVAPAIPAENAVPDAARGLAGMVLVRVTMSGSNGAARGVEQGIRACSNFGCGPTIQPPGDDSPPAEYTLTAASGGLPPGADRVELVSRCIRTAGCPVGEGIIYRDLQVGMVDHTPPSIHLDEIGPGWEPIDARPGPWHRDEFSWAATVRDAESGVFYTVTDGPRSDPPPGEDGTCLPPIVVPSGWWCAMWDGVGSSTSVVGLPQGLNTIAARVVDLAGNEAVGTLPFRVDTVPPGPPTDLNVTGAGHGWIASTHAELRWRNAPAAEAGETATTSGLAGALVDVDPMEPSWTDAWPQERVSLSSLESLDLALPEPGLWEVTVRLIDRAGNIGLAERIPVRVDPLPIGAPEITAVAPITAETARAGLVVGWSLADRPPSGICGYAFALNGVADYDPGDDARHADLPGDRLRVDLAPATIAALDDGPTYVHLRAFSCAGAVGPLAHALVITDVTPPTVSAAATAAWVDDPASVAFTGSDVSPSGNGSGVARLEVSVDGGTSTTYAASTAAVALHEGEHSVVAVAVDHAGNRSTQQRVDVGVDATAPQVAIAPVDAADPLAVRATASDGGAGLATATLEYRAANGGAWQRLGRRFVAATPRPDPVTIDARFPDEQELAAGDYELRIVAADGLGHVAETSSRVDGTPAVVTSPVRPRPSLTAQLTAAKVGATPTQLTGRLAGADGAPIVGGAVELISAVQGGVPQQAGRGVTDAAGGFRFAIAAGGSRVFTVSFRGTPTVGPARTSVTLQVHAGATLRITPRVLRGRSKATFRGRVLSPGVALPLAGKTVEIDVRAGGRWKPFGVPRRTASDGTFRIGFRANPGRRTARIAFRVRVPLEAGWPLLDGVSAVKTVVVTP